MTLLDRLVITAVLRAFVLVAASLTALFSLFDFVDQLGNVGQGHYRLFDAATFVFLTAPSRLVAVTPVAMLLGCLLSLGALGRHAELVAMESLGMSEGRIILAALRLVVPTMIVVLLLGEFVVPLGQRLAQERRATELTSLETARGENSFWAQGDDRFLNVQRFEYGNVPEDVDIYAFDRTGGLREFIHADRANVRPDGRWRLENVVSITVSGAAFRTRHAAFLDWQSFMSPRQTELLILPPSCMPPLALLRYVHHLRRTGQPATLYEQEIWSRISTPFSLVAMIMIAAPFVFGPPRSRSAGTQMMVGALIGVAFSLAQQITGRLDLLLDLGTGTLALVPSLILMSVAAYLFLALRR